MKQIIKIFKQLEATPGKNDKLEILRENKDTELFKKVLYFIFSPFILTGISDKKISKQFNIQKEECTLSIIEAMDYIKSHNSGRDEDIKFIQKFIMAQDEEDQKFYHLMFTKNVKVGITSKSVNKVFGKGFIEVFDVMLAEKFHEYKHKIKGRDFILTTKLNGHRGVIMKDHEGNIKMFTREGKPYSDIIEVEEEAKLLPNGFVYDGEFTVKNYRGIHSKEVYKATSKIIRKDGIKTGLVFRIFDIAQYDNFNDGCEPLPCHIRKGMIHGTINANKFNFIEEVPVLYKGNDMDVIQPLLDEHTRVGEEGLMLNLADAPYQCKRTPDILKIKEFKTADVRCLAVVPGKNKNKGKLGAIIIQFEHLDKLWECECGSGFDDNERVLYFNNPELIVGKIVQIEYFEVTQNKKGNYGLQFATWEHIIRDDKDEISMY